MEHQVIAVGLNDGDSYAVGGLELDRFGKLEDPPVGLLLFWRNRPAGFGILVDRTLEGPTVLLEARFERSERDLSFLDLAAIVRFDEDLQFVDDKVRVGCIESQALACVLGLDLGHHRIEFQDLVSPRGQFELQLVHIGRWPVGKCPDRTVRFDDQACLALGGGRNGLGNGPFRIDERLRFGPNTIEVRDRFLPLLLKPFEFGLLQLGGDRKLWLVVVAIGIFGLVEDRVELVIVFDGDRIVLVRMALGTPHGQSHPNLKRRIDTVFHGSDSKLFIIGPPFVIAQGRPMERRGDTLSRRGILKQVPCELFDGELIVRHIVVERLDHPIAIGPKFPS